MVGVGAVAVIHRSPATCHPPPGGLAAVTPDAAVGVVVVVISVTAGTVFTVGAIVVFIVITLIHLPEVIHELPL
jgi:hypothetical protein